MEKTLAYIFYIMQVKEQNVLVALKKGHFMLSFHQECQTHNKHSGNTNLCLTGGTKEKQAAISKTDEL